MRECARADVVVVVVVVALTVNSPLCAICGKIGATLAATTLFGNKAGKIPDWFIIPKFKSRNYRSCELLITIFKLN